MKNLKLLIVPGEKITAQIVEVLSKNERRAGFYELKMPGGDKGLANDSRLT